MYRLRGLTGWLVGVENLRPSNSIISSFLSLCRETAGTVKDRVVTRLIANRIWDKGMCLCTQDTRLMATSEQQAWTANVSTMSQPLHYQSTDKLSRLLRNSLFWFITQLIIIIIIISYRRFGTTYRSNPQGSRGPLETCGWDRYVVPKRRLEITTTHCVIKQKSAFLSYFTTEASHHLYAVSSSHYIRSLQAYDAIIDSETRYQ